MEPLEILPPDECFNCKTPLATLIDAYGGFIAVPVLCISKSMVLPVRGIFLLGCPHCGAVSLNKNAQLNLKQVIQENEKSKLIAKPASGLILPH